LVRTLFILCPQLPKLLADKNKQHFTIKDIKIMKKIVLTLFSIFAVVAFASAETKTAYCDIYARGGGRNLKVTAMFGGKPYSLGTHTDLGSVLNTLSKDGWEIDQSLVIPRNGFLVFCTRHKLHLIMKKEYNEGENPFANLQKVKKAATGKK
jgi:hypothetical protein